MNIAVIVLVSVAALCMAAQPIKEECQKSPKSLPRNCCTMPKFADEETLKCLNDKKETLEHCLFKGATVIKDNEIDRTAVIAALETKFAATAGLNKVLHGQVADKCIERANAHKVDEEKNNYLVYILNICLENEYLKNCPESAWTASDTCTAWKKYVKDCPLFGRRGEKPE